MLFLWHKLKTIHLCPPTRYTHLSKLQQPAPCYLVHNNSPTLAIAAPELDTWSGDNGNFIQTHHFHTITISENTISISHNNMICSVLGPGLGWVHASFCFIRQVSWAASDSARFQSPSTMLRWLGCLDKCLKISSTIISPSISAFQCVDHTWCLNTKCDATHASLRPFNNF